MRKAQAAALVAVAALAMASSWRTFLSPGPVGAPHQGTEANCDACHLVYEGVPDEKCHACHEEIALLDRRKIGFHGAVRGQPCLDCHTDHHGRAGALTRAESIRAFSHDRTEFPLSGAHADLGCARCHGEPLRAMDGGCADCHDDPHGGGLGSACADCHEASGWSDLRMTLADHALAMDGGHAGLGCQDCHDQGENILPSVPCANCHERAHGGTRAPCSTCHEVNAFLPASFDHGPCTCSFPGKHQTAECLACHENFNFTNTPTLCSGCHSDERPHEPLGECSRCHTATSWADNRFDHNRSARFALSGAHLSVDCTGCHYEPGIFRGAPTKCSGCHAKEGPPAHGDFGECSGCHTPDAFAPSSFDHEARTGFPLAGRHAALGCQDCHAEKVRGYPL